MPITKTEVEKIALLANLELTEEEKVSFSGQLAEIVDYIDQLNELETTAVQPWSQRRAKLRPLQCYPARSGSTKPWPGARARAVPRF